MLKKSLNITQSLLRRVSFMSAEYWSQWGRDEILSMLDVPSEQDSWKDINLDEKLDQNDEECVNIYTYQLWEEW